jgi:hypothetical protein
MIRMYGPAQCWTFFDVELFLLPVCHGARMGFKEIQGLELLLSDARAGVTGHALEIWHQPPGPQFFFFCKQQHSYTGLGDVLSRLPLPTTVDQPWLSVHNAMEAGMLHSMDDEESLLFTAMA